MPDRPGIGEPLAALGTGDGSEPVFTTRPVITGRKGVVAAGHYLAAMAGMKMLEAGGNAIDAGVAAGFALALLEPQNNGLGGEAPILIYHARASRVAAINGQGVAPRAATVEWFRQAGIRLIPGDGLLPATVPSQVDNWITALDQFGTLPLAAVLAPALELARDGFAMTHGLSRCIAANQERFQQEWPATGAVYLPGGQVPRWGDRFCNPDWAATCKKLVAADAAASGGRSQRLRAARDVFYRSEIAERIADFCAATEVRDASGASHRGLLAYEDLAGYHARVEDPVSYNYRGLDVHKCGPWCQGPVFLQQLALLQAYDLRELGHNTPDTIHLVVECAKLAFADREYYYGDPAFVQVPLDRLLSDDYNHARRALVDPRVASADLRPGDAGPRPAQLLLGDAALYDHDTTHLDVIDAEGNMIAATPSGGWIQSSPVVPGLGFPLGTRGQMFSLDPEHPNCLQPGKRPRATLTPSLVTREGRPWMVFGTPGGDQQDQWTLQFFLNVVDFGMDIQGALDAPTFHSQHFPSSFYPRAAYPKRLVVEGRIPARVCEELARRGHEVVVTGGWQNGRVLGIRFDPDRQLIFGGASPRNETGYAIGW
jgi:gamma-glutamyltranspeptidase/glutathione hydrolase